MYKLRGEKGLHSMVTGSLLCSGPEHPVEVELLEDAMALIAQGFEALPDDGSFEDEVVFETDGMNPPGEPVVPDPEPEPEPEPGLEVEPEVVEPVIVPEPEPEPVPVARRTSRRKPK